ncbi:MAG: hypothetical protein Q9160_002353 [Pyrenula sp. 1 TL-2023]
MTDKLPPQLLALFSPRPPLRYIPPQDQDPQVHASKPSQISGVANFLPALSEYTETDDYEPTESWLQRKDRLKQEKKERVTKVMSEGFDGYKPQEDPQIRGDAFKTLFISRLSYDVKENDLEREFGRFGPIERIRIVKNDNEKNQKKTHRGYAFIVYEREKDMKAAYKETDGIRIKDRRVLVDVERGRTVKGWKPRRFGGGLGGRGYTRAAPARPGGFNAPAGPGFQGGPGFRGGFGGRGGFRGGFRGDRGGGFGGRGGIGYQGGGGFEGRGGFGAVLVRGAALAAVTEADNPMARALNTVTRGAMALAGTGAEIDHMVEEDTEIATLAVVLEVIVSLSAEETGATEVTEIATETETEIEAMAADATTTIRENGITMAMGTMIQDRNGDIEHFQQRSVTVCWWVSSYISSDFVLFSACFPEHEW